MNSGYWRIIIICSLLLISLGCNHQTDSKVKTSQFPSEASLLFPDDALGVYKGTLNISNPRGEQTIPMEFHLLATDSLNQYDYVLIYNEQPRNYTLITKDPEKGIYEVDENNGIILPTYLNNNTLHSFFEVNNNLLSSRLHFFQDRVDFEILFASQQQKIPSGSGDEVKVFGIPISTFQKATLYKQ